MIQLFYDSFKVHSAHVCQITMTPCLILCCFNVTEIHLDPKLLPGCYEKDGH
jgi:hypothetical protein